ncbi:hypothetical protein GECvBN6_gp141 [Salmonella phage GEC_vB_N6]|nr:hypothetical protein GECvBN6_gp141 [Salmonella phage GEC_vB_N6]
MIILVARKAHNSYITHGLFNKKAIFIQLAK